ncbi:MAG: tetratricopeptide repeat protein [Sporolactobacillus sp.]
MKKTGESGQKKENLLLFPQLDERLLQKASARLEERRFSEARGLFEKLLSLDPDNRRGLYGWTVCSIELGDFESAERAVRQLIRRGTVHYADVFRLYLTILIEKKDYRAALHEIERAKGDSQLKKLAEFLARMTDFCSKRLDESGEVPLSESRAQREAGKKKRRSRSDFSWADLEKTDPGSRLMLIRDLTPTLGVSDLPEIERFLLDERQNAEVKTILLCAVQENQLATEISMRKFGQTYRVVFDEHFLNRRLTACVEAEMERALLSENPTLSTLAMDLARSFMVAVYPKPLADVVPNVWAAYFAVRAAAAEDGDADARDELLERFHVDGEALAPARQFVEETERCGIWPQQV